MSAAQIFLVEASAFDSQRPALVALLRDAVGQGASIGFLAGLNEAEANAYWNGVHAAMLRGERLLWIAVDAQSTVGTVQLDLCQRPNGVNRAEIQKMMVHSSARRAGVGAALLADLEREARARQRGVLYCDTEAGSGAEGFYLRQGYTCIGGIPEYACSPDGVWRANAIYYKTLFLRSAP